ncbi:MAG: hypothetical protein M1118_08020 [Chloroflexi bacterium]|nr:hypothetical protein [Chloroflexota bacterium]
MKDGYRYVTLQGHIRIVDDPQQTQDDIRALAIRYSGPERSDREQGRNQFLQETRVSLYPTVEKIIANGLK